jgi:hypothetical protein
LTLFSLDVGKRRVHPFFRISAHFAYSGKVPGQRLPKRSGISSIDEASQFAPDTIAPSQSTAASALKAACVLRSRSITTSKTSMRLSPPYGI